MVVQSVDLASSNPALRKRKTVVGLLLTALLLCYIDRTIISLAAIKMQQEFGWTDTQKGLVLSVFYGGYLMMQLAGGLLSNKFGGRNVFFLAVLAWSICTILTPAAAYTSFAVLIGARVILGLGEGPAYPASYNLIHGWVPPEERSRAVALISSAAAVGTVFALLVTGKMMDAFGWPLVFYLFGSMGLVWAAFWLFMVPSTAPLDEERANLSASKRKIPWKILLFHPSVVILYLVALGGQAASFFIASWLPSYLVDTFAVTTTTAGLYAILPWLALAIITYLAGLYADRRIQSGENSLPIRRRMLRIGFGLMITGFLCLTVAPNVQAAIFLVFLVFAGLGIVIPGFSTVPAELLPHHGDILFGFVSSFATIMSMIYVAGTGVLLDLTGSYNLMFVLVAATCMMSALIFQFFSRTDEILLNQQFVSVPD